MSSFKKERVSMAILFPNCKAQWFNYFNIYRTNSLISKPFLYFVNKKRFAIGRWNSLVFKRTSNKQTILWAKYVPTTCFSIIFGNWQWGSIIIPNKNVNHFFVGFFLKISLVACYSFFLRPHACLTFHHNP